MTVYHFAPIAPLPALTLVALLAMLLLEPIASKAAQKIARVRAISRSRNAARLGYRQRPRR